MVIRYPTIWIAALLTSGAIVAGCSAVDPTAPTVTATIAVESIEAVRELTTAGAHVYYVSFAVRETKGATGATVKAVDLQFNNGFTTAFGADSVPHVGAGRMVESKQLSVSDPNRTRVPATSLTVRLLVTDDEGTDSTPVATKNVLSAYVLSGFVTEVSTGRPIPNATVRITFGPDAGRSTTTNLSGRYMFTTLVQGPISFTVNAPGHVTQTKAIDVLGDVQLDVALVRS